MEEDDFISKTQRKRQMSELQDVGAALVKLSAEQLARLDIPEALREAVLEAKRITKHEAGRRQRQWIGKLMRHIDAGPIVEQLSALSAPTRKQTALFHVAEKWRDDVMKSDDAVARFAVEFPAANVTRLKALAGAAREERSAKRAPKVQRELFHAINTTIQDHARKP
jgi:ribosome-associated protein